MNTRKIALDALMDITERGAYANLRLKTAQSGLSAADAKWVAALVYETLDHLLYLDYVLAGIAKGQMKPVIRCILRMGACQMLFMRVPPAAACDESVKLVKQTGKGALSGYVNGVLRSLSRQLDALPTLPQDVAARLSIQYSWPLFLVEEWLGRFGGEETQRLLGAKPLPMQLRAQPPFTTDMLSHVLRERGIAYTPGAHDPNCLRLLHGFDIVADPLFLNGSMTVQSESAMLVCRACGAKPAMRVLDACAAPGGKSAYLYALTNGAIDLHAWETHPHRVELLKKTLARLHACATIREQDATAAGEEYDAYFDIVLVDAPCSGLGVGKPDVRYAKTAADIQTLIGLQSGLLGACAVYVKPGGVLVYATCTISHGENEGQIADFLKKHPAFCLEDLSPYIGKDIPGAQCGMVQLLPHRDYTEGFFIARMRKASACI